MFQSLGLTGREPDDVAALEYWNRRTERRAVDTDRAGAGRGLRRLDRWPDAYKIATSLLLRT